MRSIPGTDIQPNTSFAQSSLAPNPRDLIGADYLLIGSKLGLDTMVVPANSVLIQSQSTIQVQAGYFAFPWLPSMNRE